MQHQKITDLISEQHVSMKSSKSNAQRKPQLIPERKRNLDDRINTCTMHTTVRSIKRSGTYKNSAENTAFHMPLQFTNMEGKNVRKTNDVMPSIKNCFNLRPLLLSISRWYIWSIYASMHRPLVPMTYDIRCRSCSSLYLAPINPHQLRTPQSMMHASMIFSQIYVLSALFIWPPKGDERACYAY